MKILLIGGSGHVGTFITPHLKHRHDLRVLDVREPSHDVEFIRGSITDVNDLTRALSGVDSFINLVMWSEQDGNESDQSVAEIEQHYAVNTVGLHLLLHVAHGCGVTRGVHTSTLTVHDRQRVWYPAEERVPLDAPGVYGLTKGFGELICQYFARWFDMNLIALRISMPSTRAQWLERRAQGRMETEDGVRLFALDEEDLAQAYLSALAAVQVGHGRFDAVYVVGDELEEEHNLSKARRLLGWEPREYVSDGGER